MYSLQNYVIRFAACQWFSPGTLVSSTSEADNHNIAEILLNVTLSTICCDIYCFFFKISTVSFLKIFTVFLRYLLHVSFLRYLLVFFKDIYCFFLKISTVSFLRYLLFLFKDIYFFQDIYFMFLF